MDPPQQTSRKTKNELDRRNNEIDMGPSSQRPPARQISSIQFRKRVQNQQNIRSSGKWPNNKTRTQNQTQKHSHTQQSPPTTPTQPHQHYRLHKHTTANYNPPNKMDTKWEPDWNGINKEMAFPTLDPPAGGADNKSPTRQQRIPYTFNLDLPISRDTGQ